MPNWLAGQLWLFLRVGAVAALLTGAGAGCGPAATPAPAAQTDQVDAELVDAGDNGVTEVIAETTGETAETAGNGDVSPDVPEAPKAALHSCFGRCMRYQLGTPCQCDRECGLRGDCCNDFAERCVCKTLADCLPADADCSAVECSEDGFCMHETWKCETKSPCTALACDPSAADSKVGYGCVGLAVPDGSWCDGGECLWATCSGGSCQNSLIPLTFGSKCRDDNPCTEDGQCWAGMCEFSMTCDDNNNPCIIESCDPKVGDCHVALAGDGTPCAEATDCKGPGTCKAGKCTAVALPDDATCNGWNPCFTGATCQGGYCEAGKTVVVGVPCITPPYPDGACMLNGKCQPDGSCKGSGVLCPDDVVCQYSYYCDKEANTCTKVTSPAGDYCYDGEPCTTNDHCVNGACVADATLPDGYLCNDDNECTAGDQCFGGSCAGKAAPEKAGAFCSPGGVCGQVFTCQQGLCAPAPGPAGVSCYDANPCTADSCAPSLLSGEITCTHVATASMEPCATENPCAISACSKGVCVSGKDLCTAVWTENFDGPTAAAWVHLPAPVSDSAGWAIDATPALPGFHSPPHSLNFNNGKTFQMFQGAKETIAAGASIGPPVTVPKGKPVLRFWSWHGVETLLQWDLRWVEVSTDGFATPPAVSQLVDNKTAPLQWSQVVVPLTALAGKQVQIRFRLDSLDAAYNDGPGWFVDDLEFAVVGP